MQVTRYESSCIIKQVNTKKEVLAEVLDFKEKQKLSVVLNKSVKLSLVWNGKNYEGKMAGIDFESAGPKITKTQIGRG